MQVVVVQELVELVLQRQLQGLQLLMQVVEVVMEMKVQQLVELEAVELVEIRVLQEQITQEADLAEQELLPIVI
tara:strand:+ start:405 stop:626 length:222 start_codon:yes stop_codon:yes gene_type:complete